MQIKSYSRFFTFILIVLCARLEAACTLTAKCAGGNWDAATTWVPSGCGAVTTPTDNCIIIIPACATVNVNINSPEYVNMEIYVYGTLDFGSGQKINMCPGYIKIFSGGQLTGGTPGSKINICGTTVYNGGSTATGPFELGGGTTLPVELLFFEARECGNEVCLEWATASETNNDFFTVERSPDGSTFSEIAKLEGAGTSSAYHSYSVTDELPLDGLSYYRLRQTDLDLQESYSGIIAISVQNTGQTFEIFPNPSNGNVMFATGALSGSLVIEVFASDGRRVAGRIVAKGEGADFSGLDPGSYFVSLLQADGSRISRKMIITGN